MRPRHTFRRPETVAPGVPVIVAVPKLVTPLEAVIAPRTLTGGSHVGESRLGPD
jgi:hypothetical protein